MTEYLQTLAADTATPAFAAFLLGLLTAVSPCPLATNIAAVGYLSKDLSSRGRVLSNAVLYSLGRIAAYTILGIALIAILRSGGDFYEIQKSAVKYGEKILPIFLFACAAAIWFVDKINLPNVSAPKFVFGMKANSAGAFIMGAVFAMAFCPSSGLFYFGMLIPLSASAEYRYWMPVLFGAATALPVVAAAWALAAGISKIGDFYNAAKKFEFWFRRAVALLFLAAGAYYSYIFYL